MQLRNDGVTWREIDGEMIILDLTSSTYMKTNRTGGFLLQRLVEERSHDDLVAALVDEFGVSTERASNDVSAFVDALHERGLLMDPVRS